MLPCIALVLVFAASRPQEPTVAQRYDFTPVAPDAKQVPVGFQGHDVRAFLDIIAASVGQGKGQFEKSSDAEARMRKALEGIRMGGQTIRGPFAFAPKNVKERSYDADKEMATVKVADDNMHHGNDREITMRGDEAFATSEGVTSDGTYTAQNVFGVRTLVSGETAVRFGVIVKEPTPKNKWIGRAGLEYDGLAFSFPMPVEKAKGMLDRLRVLFIVSFDPFDPSGRFFSQDTFKTKPTLDSPFDLDYTNLFMGGTLRSVLVYDPQTGEVVFSHAVKG